MAELKRGQRQKQLKTELLLFFEKETEKGI